jgi:hypothetical protein
MATGAQAGRVRDRRSFLTGGRHRSGWAPREPRCLPTHFCSTPSIPMARKLAYLLPTSASSCFSFALNALAASMSANCSRTTRLGGGEPLKLIALLKPPARYLPPDSLMLARAFGRKSLV